MAMGAGGVNRAESYPGISLRLYDLHLEIGCLFRVSEARAMEAHALRHNLDAWNDDVNFRPFR